jgi:hypothetical protein
MTKVWRAVLIAVVAWSILSASSIYSAFVGRVPNDSGMLVAIFAHPTYLVLMPAYESLRSIAAAWLHHPVDDRFAMEFDAITGWLMGCLQYGAVAALLTMLRKAAQPNVRAGLPRSSPRQPLN